MVATSTSRLKDAHDPGTTTGEGTSSGHVMDLLEEHVPISLLMDLVAPTGPDSQDILTTEGAPDEAWWLQGV